MIRDSVACQAFCDEPLQEVCVRMSTACYGIARPSYSKKIQIAHETIHPIKESLQTKYMSVAIYIYWLCANCR